MEMSQETEIRVGKGVNLDFGIKDSLLLNMVS